MTGSGLRKEYSQFIENHRVMEGQFASRRGDRFGMFNIRSMQAGTLIRILVSDGLGWDHVSVSTKTRCPTWSEMSYIKALFFDDACCVIQYHPPATKHINIHEYCLHLWHKHDSNVEMPPTIMV